ncbi:translation initiation factor IF-2 [Streptomyces sp. PA03-3a]|nr:translation initiation factor IF-2 [Streptomyces sp. PA03-3a]
MTVGVGAYLMSVPDGVPVSIEALRKHFTEGETRLARALNELEAEGFLERVPVRAANGQVRTRTYVYDDPSPAAPATGRIGPQPRNTVPSETPPEPEPARAPEPQPTPEPLPQPASRPIPRLAPATAPPTAEAVAVLAALRLKDPRLLLSERDVTRLAPAVDNWLRRGIAPDRIAATLSADLPGPILRRPAGLIAYRLQQLKPIEAAPLPAPHAQRPRVLPLQNCDACDRAHRAEHPGLCRDCATTAAVA